MKIILLKNVENLGKEGEIKEVSMGYARNFLIPRGLADVASPDIIAYIEKRKQREANRAEIDLHKTEKLVSQLDGQEFEISAKSTDAGTLYASITTAKISSILKARGYNVMKDQIIFEMIKTVGEHKVSIKFPHGLECSIKVIVTAINTNA